MNGVFGIQYRPPQPFIWETFSIELLSNKTHMAFMSLQLSQTIKHIGLPLSHHYLVYTRRHILTIYDMPMCIPINKISDQPTALQQSTLNFVCAVTKPT